MRRGAAAAGPKVPPARKRAMVPTHWYQYAMVRARRSASANASRNPAGNASASALPAVSALAGRARTGESGSSGSVRAELAQEMLTRLAESFIRK